MADIDAAARANWEGRSRAVLNLRPNDRPPIAWDELSDQQKDVERAGAQAVLDTAASPLNDPHLVGDRREWKLTATEVEAGVRAELVAGLKQGQLELIEASKIIAGAGLPMAASLFMAAVGRMQELVKKAEGEVT